MAGRSARNKKNVPQKTQETIGTQTSPDRYVDEIELLKKELKLMKLEVRMMRGKDKPDSSSQIKEVEEKTVVAAADSPKPPKALTKGCTCKGKCNSKVCGCVKKQIACSDLCRCTHARCQNQEPDKENIAAPKSQAQISSDSTKNANHLAEVNLKENVRNKEASGLADERVQRVAKATKSLFSPDTSGIYEYKSFRELDVEDILEFSDPKKNVHFDSDSSSEEVKKRRQPKPKQTKNQAESPAPKTNKSGIETSVSNETKQQLFLTTNNYVQKTTSASGEERETLTKSIMKKVKTPTKKKIQKTPTKSEVTSGRKSQQLQNERNQGTENLLTIDPMKPTHQLMRTPPSHATSFSTSMNRSEIQQPEIVRALSPMPIIKVNRSSGFDEPQINWDEHYAQLVRCKHCNRTFYPDRLEKHESNCKRV